MSGYEDYRRKYEEEYAIVDRVWGALGHPRYEDLNGKTIDTLVAEVRADAARWRRIALALAGRSVDLWPAEGGGWLCHEDGWPAVKAETEEAALSKWFDAQQQSKEPT